MLTKIPSEEDIKQIAWLLPNHKSSGPDNFGPNFYRKVWNTIKMDLVSNIQRFFISSELPHLWNRTYITLIPKTKVQEPLLIFARLAHVISATKLSQKFSPNI